MARTCILEERKKYDLQIQAAIDYINQNSHISKRQIPALFGVSLSALCDRLNGT